MDRKDAITNTLLGIVALAGIPVMALGPDLFPEARALFFWAGVVLILGALTGIVLANRSDARSVSGASRDALPAQINPILFNAQLQEIREVEEFIGRKSEIELRETFDFDQIVPYNLESVRARIIGKKLDDLVVMNFNLVGSRMDPKRMKVTREGEDSIPMFDDIPGRVGVVHLSSKHIESCRTLDRFTDSSQLPTDVVTALRVVYDAVNDNIKLLMDVLDESLQDDERNITDYDKRGQYEGRVANLYTRRFIALKPLAAAVNTAIRRHLNIA